MAVFRAPRPAWTMPPPDVIGVSEPTRTAFLFSQGDQRIKGTFQGDPMGPNPAGTAAAVVTTKYGRGYELVDGSRGLVSANNTFNTGHYSATYLARIDSMDNPWGMLLTWTNSAGNGNRIMVGRNSTTDNVLAFHGGTTSATICATTLVEDGIWGWMTIVYDGVNCSLYMKGKLLGSGAITVDPTTSAATDKLKIGVHRGNGNYETLGQFAAFYALDRAMTPAEIRHRHSPQGQWDWLRTAPQPFIETSAAGGDVDVDVTATVGAIAITALSPTVSIDHDVAAALGALTITGHNPTVSIDHDISAAAGTIAITALSPTVSIDHDVAAALGAITLTGYNPSVNSTTNVDLGALTITGHKASVSIPSSDSDYYRPWTHARLSEQPDKNQFGDDPMNTNLSPPSVIDGRKMGTKATNLKRAVGGVEKSASKAGKGKQTKSTDKKR